MNDNIVAAEKTPPKSAQVITTEPEPTEVITTTAGQVLTVKDGVDSLLFGGNYTLAMLPGDEQLLDMLINSEVEISTFKDLYKASNGKIGHVVINDQSRQVRLLPLAARQRVKSFNDPVINNVPQETSELQQTVKNTVAPARNSTMTLRALIVEYADQHNQNFIEQPSNNEVLSEVITSEPITDLSQLHALSKGRISNILFDKEKSEIQVITQRQEIIQTTTLREVIARISQEKGYTLLELPGDERLLDQDISPEHDIIEWQDIHNLAPIGAKRVIIDEFTKTVRII